MKKQRYTHLYTFAMTEEQWNLISNIANISPTFNGNVAKVLRNMIMSMVKKNVSRGGKDGRI